MYIGFDTGDYEWHLVVGGGIGFLGWDQCHAATFGLAAVGMHSVETRDLEPLLMDLQRKPSLVQPRFYDEAMQTLLQRNIDLAVELTLQFVPMHPNHALSQEWMEFLVSQEATTDRFTSEFLMRYRRTGCTTGSG